MVAYYHSKQRRAEGRVAHHLITTDAGAHLQPRNANRAGKRVGVVVDQPHWVVVPWGDVFGSHVKAVRRGGAAAMIGARQASQ
jgi:hypothetical protein